MYAGRLEHAPGVVNQKFVEEQTQVPFDYAQGMLSTAIGAKYAPISAQDDSLFFTPLPMNKKVERKVL